MRYVWGPPGVGKSQGVREIAREIEKKTEKDVHITDMRLLLFNPVDLRGIPTANEDKTLAVRLKPQIFQITCRLCFKSGGEESKRFLTAVLFYQSNQ